MIAADRTAFAAVAQAALGQSVNWTNRGFDTPAKSTAPGTPASWFSLEGLEYFDTEDADFGGGEIRRGEGILGCWVEPGCGEDLVAQMVDTVRAAYGSAPASGGMTFFACTPEPYGFRDFQGTVWYGWLVRVPFVAQG